MTTEIGTFATSSCRTSQTTTCGCNDSFARGRRSSTTTLTKRATAVDVRSHICVALDVCPWLHGNKGRPATPTAGRRPSRTRTAFTCCCEPAAMEDRAGPQRHGYASEKTLCPRPPSKGQGWARAATPWALQSLGRPWALHASFHTTINGLGRPRAAVVATIWLRVTMFHVVGQAPWLLDSHARAPKTEITIIKCE